MRMKEISAGGVVYRNTSQGIEVQLITDRYGKISFAKGKREAGETIEQTALREIVEETGVEGRIIQSIDIIAYTYQHSEHGEVDKEVHYYLVESKGGELRPQIEEIRGVAWYEPKEAWEKQQKSGYDNNDFILEKGLKLLGFDF
ncbi:8-oxo-dGTP pyrophosphatase MutT (NUDIX family) [Paenibacillus shirakamiensis]|uniref:8-oxo-dGTP pyrophosphatase MutT (NUDIX family) n=2 Tax=Paenibacillus shirakamiensis TaxID=1265935 RepID=A0ABS4JBS6_9BACL|nr:NUDIX domain-containing protein [Paenibacillus shirakamiensis]MBP1999153.1 8-oxo-dGTP pyrophosphatase MutT (NUDIX family) [Paenibacillus shirakamiensis]